MRNEVDTSSRRGEGMGSETNLATSFNPDLSMASAYDFAPEGNLEGVGRVRGRRHRSLTVGETANAKDRAVFDSISDDGLEWEGSGGLEMRYKSDSVNLTLLGGVSGWWEGRGKDFRLVRCVWWRVGRWSWVSSSSSSQHSGDRRRKS